MVSGHQSAARKKPRQKRSAQTFELILDTAASLLEEVGLDKLNTNLICERAGLTPPALYRYFPNKYAIMEELGRRLMKAQNVKNSIIVPVGSKGGFVVKQINETFGSTQ